MRHWTSIGPHAVADCDIGADSPIPDRTRGDSARCHVSRAAAVVFVVHSIYIATTVLAAFANGFAAFLNFRGAESVKTAADRVRIPRTWMIPLGSLLALGAAGLVTGFACPAVGLAAATGLLVYFMCAVIAHLRAGDRHIGGAVLFLFLATASLAANIAYHVA